MINQAQLDQLMAQKDRALQLCNQVKPDPEHLDFETYIPMLEDAKSLFLAIEAGATALLESNPEEKNAPQFSQLVNLKITAFHGLAVVNAQLSELALQQDSQKDVSELLVQAADYFVQYDKLKNNGESKKNLGFFYASTLYPLTKLPQDIRIDMALKGVEAIVDAAGLGILPADLKNALKKAQAILGQTFSADHDCAPPAMDRLFQIMAHCAKQKIHYEIFFTIASFLVQTFEHFYEVAYDCVIGTTPMEISYSRLLRNICLAFQHSDSLKALGFFVEKHLVKYEEKFTMVESQLIASDLYTTYAFGLFSSGDYENSVTYFKKALAIRESHCPASYPPVRLLGDYAGTFAALSEGRVYEEAKAMAQRALDNVQVIQRSKLGELEAHLGITQESVQTQITEKTAEIYLNLGVLHARNNEPTQSAQMLKQAKNLLPKLQPGTKLYESLKSRIEFFADNQDFLASSDDQEETKKIRSYKTDAERICKAMAMKKIPKEDFEKTAPILADLIDKLEATKFAKVTIPHKEFARMHYICSLMFAGVQNAEGVQTQLSAAASHANKAKEDLELFGQIFTSLSSVTADPVERSLFAKKAVTILEHVRDDKGLQDPHNLALAYFNYAAMINQTNPFNKKNSLAADYAKNAYFIWKQKNTESPNPIFAKLSTESGKLYMSITGTFVEPVSKGDSPVLS